MEQFLFLLLVSALTGFVAGVFGSVCHQYHQRNADQKRWEFIKGTSTNLNTVQKTEPKKED
jgi:hypothetical protein